MNTAALAKSAYGDTNALVPLGRDTEYRAFALVTRRLSVQQNATTGYSDLLSALHENLRLWSMLAEDVASMGNELPATLRAQLFYLYEFTKSHSKKIVSETGSPEILVEINTSIMRGLRSRKIEA